MKGISLLKPAALHTGWNKKSVKVAAVWALQVWLRLPKVLLQQFQAMWQWELSTMQTRCWREQRRIGLLSAWRRARPPALRPEWESGGRSWLVWAGGRTSWLPIKNSAKWSETEESDLLQQPIVHPDCKAKVQLILYFPSVRWIIKQNQKKRKSHKNFLEPEVTASNDLLSSFQAN